MFNPIHLCKVDDAIIFWLEETIMSFHSPFVLYWGKLTIGKALISQGRFRFTEKIIKIVKQSSLWCSSFLVLASANKTIGWSIWFECEHVNEVLLRFDVNNLFEYDQKSSTFVIKDVIFYILHTGTAQLVWLKSWLVYISNMSLACLSSWTGVDQMVSIIALLFSCSYCFSF